MTYAEAFFELGEIQSDGEPLIVHLESVERQTKKTPEQLKKLPPAPWLYRHVWEWYKEIQETRTHNGDIFNPIDYREIKAWSDVTGNILTAWEVRLIRSLDVVHLKFLNKVKK